MNQTLAMMFKIFFVFIFITIFLTVFFFATSYQQAVSFKSYVGEQINREGGLTSQALSNIQQQNENLYNGRFTVESKSGNDKKPFGTQVDYTISVKVQSNFFDTPPTILSVPGTSSSRVR